MQDFANHKINRDFEGSELANAEWAPDFPSLMAGVILGVFLAIMGFKVAEYREETAVLVEASVVEEEVEEKSFVFEFYEALKIYEVLPHLK